jgi:hypothetical protein
VRIKEKEKSLRLKLSIGRELNENNDECLRLAKKGAVKQMKGWVFLENKPYYKSAG